VTGELGRNLEKKSRPAVTNRTTTAESHTRLQGNAARTDERGLAASRWNLPSRVFSTAGGACMCRVESLSSSSASSSWVASVIFVAHAGQFSTCALTRAPLDAGSIQHPVVALELESSRSRSNSSHVIVHTSPAPQPRSFFGSRADRPTFS
jgi:hypothetical protein